MPYSIIVGLLKKAEKSLDKAMLMLGETDREKYTAVTKAHLNDIEYISENISILTRNQAKLLSKADSYASSYKFNHSKTDLAEIVKELRQGKH